MISGHFAASVVIGDRIRPLVDNVYPLSAVHEAARRMAGGEVFGKLVVLPSKGISVMMPSRGCGDLRWRDQAVDPVIVQQGPQDVDQASGQGE